MATPKLSALALLQKADGDCEHTTPPLWGQRSNCASLSWSPLSAGSWEETFRWLSEPNLGFELESTSLSLLDKFRAELDMEWQARPPVQHCGSAVPNQHRNCVCSWLVEVADEFALQRSTLFHAVTLFDRFTSLEDQVVPPGALLQLLALACVSLAAKHQEVKQHSSQQWLSLAKGADDQVLFEVSDLVKMEYLVTEALDCTAGSRLAPNADTFLELLLPAVYGAHSTHSMELRGHVTNVAAFISELSLLDDRLVATPPSTIAAASLMLSEYLALGGNPPLPPQPFPFFDGPNSSGSNSSFSISSSGGGGIVASSAHELVAQLLPSETEQAAVRETIAALHGIFLCATRGAHANYNNGNHLLEPTFDRFAEALCAAGVC